MSSARRRGRVAVREGTRFAIWARAARAAGALPNDRIVHVPRRVAQITKRGGRPELTGPATPEQAGRLGECFRTPHSSLLLASEEKGPDDVCEKKGPDGVCEKKGAELEPSATVAPVLAFALRIGIVWGRPRCRFLWSTLFC
jgi:hypothetical protein